MMADTALKLPGGLPQGVKFDQLGRLTAPLGILVPFDENPRNPEDFDYEKSAAFRDLVNSIDEVGVREPIHVFVKADELHMLNGHRRKAAVEWLNTSREAAYRARLENGELQPGEPRPADLDLIDNLPIAIQAPPQSSFEREADMWLAESQRQKWPINRLVPFYKKTYDAAPENVRKDVKYMARRLGIAESRVRLLNSIVTSGVLTKAAVASDGSVLPVAGREKTLRSINRAAEVISSYRPNVALKVTGRYQAQDYETVEALREKMVAKASEMAKAGYPPGVFLERTAPKLKSAEKYSDDEIADWATTPGKMIAMEVAPTTVSVGGAGPANGETKGGGGLVTESKTPMLDIVEQYRRKNLEALSEEEISSLLNEVTKAAELVDQMVADAKAERRKRDG